MIEEPVGACCKQIFSSLDLSPKDILYARQLPDIRFSLQVF